MLYNITLILLFLCLSHSYLITDYTAKYSNDLYAQYPTYCEYTYRILISAESSDVDINNYSTDIPGSTLTTIKQNARNVYFSMVVQIPVNTSGTFSNSFLINSINIGGDIEYECVSVPYPLINSNFELEFKRLDQEYYYLHIRISNVVKDFDTIGPFDIVYPYPNTLQCGRTPEGYQKFTIVCKIIGFQDIHEPTIPITFTDPEGRATIFTFKSFFNTTFIDTSRPTINSYQYSNIQNSAIGYKSYYSFVEISNYMIPFYFLKGSSKSGFTNIPIYGNLEDSYTILSCYYRVFDNLNGNFSFNYLSDSTPQIIQSLYPTSNYTSRISIINLLGSTDRPLSYEISFQISKYIPFAYYLVFGNYRATSVPLYSYPYGLTSVNSNNMTVKFIYQLKTFKNTLKISTSDGPIFNATLVPPTNNPSFRFDSVSPTIENIEYIHVSGPNYLFRITASDDDSGVEAITLFYDTVVINGKDLAQGTLKNGVFEKIVNVIMDGKNGNGNGFFPFGNKAVTIADRAGNNINYFDNLDFKPIPSLIYQDISQTYHESQNQITFLRYAIMDIDLSILGCNNTIYLDFQNSTKDSIIMITITYSTGYTAIGYGEWDYNENMFAINMPLVSRLFTGFVSYSLFYNFLDYSSVEFPIEWQLYVRSEMTDRMPPLIIDVISYPSIDSNQGGIIGWILTIQDEYNGFKNGTIQVFSDIDPYVPYEFKIYPNLTNGDNIYLQNYTIEIIIPPNCITQQFYIDYIELFDQNDIKSKSKISCITLGTCDLLQETISPILKLLNDSIKLNQLIINTDCHTSKTDTQPPIITSLTLSKTSLNLFSNQRDLTANFTVEDNESPISTRHIPFCYIHIGIFDVLSVSSTIVSGSSTTDNYTISYSCKFIIPFGYSYSLTSTSLLISIHGFVDEALNFGGYTPDDLNELGFISQVEISYIKAPIIESVGSISNLQDQLTIFGFGFGIDENNLDIKIDYPDIITENRTTIFTSNTYLIVDGINSNSTSFNITVVLSGISPSNTLTVIPYDAIVIPPPSIPCEGTPECSGTDNGKCTYFGCVCFHPWTGNDCGSKIVVVPPPGNINKKNPDITTDYPTVLPNGDNVTLSSLISVDSIREFSFDGILLSEYKFDTWTYSNTTPTTRADNYNNIQEFTYHTSIKTYNDKITKIRVIVQYYHDLTTIYFSNEKIQMLPSTLKYKIEITQFGFKSNLNQLQLVMSADLHSSTPGDTTCSNQETGDIINSNLEFIKLNINSNSLYCRLIKRAVVDNRILSISNTIFDIDPSKQNGTVQRRSMGFNIPYFISSVVIDPDFSILSNLLPANENISICEYINEQENGLTSLQIVGIALGSVAFVTFVGAGVFAYKMIYNWDFRIKFLRKFNQHILLRKENKL